MNNVLVATYRYRHEGELARGFLADAGISGILANQVNGERRESHAERVHLFVRAEEADRARDILTEDYVAFS
jgi:hypothetical protein